MTSDLVNQWIAIGFGNNPGMKGADMYVVFPDGSARRKFSLDFVEPRDVNAFLQRELNLEHFQNVGGKVNFTLSVPRQSSIHESFSRFDKQMILLYASGKLGFEYHGSQVGKQFVSFLNQRERPPDEEVWDIQFNVSKLRTY